jgi:diguanylate cyclase (GGDEF)-like protein
MPVAFLMDPLACRLDQSESINMMHFRPRSIRPRLIRALLASAADRRGTDTLRSLMHPVLVTSCLVTGLTLGFRATDGLQAMELRYFDAMGQLAARPRLDPRFLIVAITEEDIQNQQHWPLTDATVARLLKQLQRYQPRAIGLDIYRDMPVPPGTTELTQQLQQPNVVSIALLGGNGPPVPAPEGVSADQVGFSDFLLDSDAVTRRSLLYAQSDGDRFYSLALRLSLLYLNSPTATPQSQTNTPSRVPLRTTHQALELGQTRFPILKPHTGSYQDLDDRGYQMLLTYHTTASTARQVSLGQVLAGEVPADWITNRIVLIGATATSAKDLFLTPRRSTQSASPLTSGVVIHMQMTSQILATVLDGQRLPWDWPEEGEMLWIAAWALVGSSLAWWCRHPLWITVGAGLAGLGLVGICFGFFLAAGWVPLVPTMIALAGSIASIVVYRLLYDTFHDSLTYLPNRTLFLRRLHHATVLRQPTWASLQTALRPPRRPLALARRGCTQEVSTTHAFTSALMNALDNVFANVPSSSKGGSINPSTGGYSHDGNAVSRADLSSGLMSDQVLSNEISFVVISIGLDRFKSINDGLGHALGDHLLVQISRRLQSCLQQGDLLARVGGDEFAILRRQVQSEADMEPLVAQIQQQWQAPFHLGQHEVFITASMGVVLHRGEWGYGSEDVLRDANTAMHQAKASGKTHHQMFAAGMRQQQVTRLQLETELHYALERQELQLHYQPIVALATGQVVGFEALMRWHHPRRGLVSPAEFIPIAEATNLIIPLGQWALQTACQQLCEWQSRFPQTSPLGMSVNLSGKQFLQPTLVEDVEAILQRTGLAACCLKLEITESVAMTDAEAAIALLGRLRALDVQLSIDDFGTGYSSLSYLHRFPTSTIKVDRSFVGRIGAGKEDNQIVQTIILLGHNLGMDIVAEGVETADQLALLRALQCDYGQGYFFSKPLTMDAVETLLREKRCW